MERWQNWLFWLCPLGRLVRLGQSQMCQCGLAMNFKFFCAVGKKLKHEAVGMSGRPVVCMMLSRLLSVCISVHCVNVVLSSFRVAGNLYIYATFWRICPQFRVYIRHKQADSKILKCYEIKS